MTAEEYALYDKVVALLESNGALAVQLLESMMKEKETPSPAFEFILGNAFYSAGQTDKAEARYRNAVRRYPNFIRAWNNLGVLYYTAGRFADAIPCFSKSIVLGDHDPLTFGLLAYSLEKEEDYVAAELAFMQAIGGDPANSDWKEGLLRICIQEKQNARAEALVKKLIKDHPKETRYWLMNANILLSENRKVEAIVLLQAAAGTKVAGADELTLLGDLYAEQGLVKEAHTTYSELQATSPATGERRLLNYAQMLITSGKLSEARNVLETLNQKISPEGRILLIQARADLLIAQKLWPEARKELETLLQISPFDGRALLTVGRTYTAEGDVDRAALAFEAAARVNSTKYLASLELANLELRNRHYADSVKYLEQALAIEKTTPVEDYLARIKTLVAKDDSSSP
jgi:tetratricopeptide (TPR) repeat protein